MVSPLEAGYRISDQPVYEDDQLARYATDDPTVFIEVFTPPEPGVAADPKLQFSMSIPPGADAEPDFSKYIDLYEDLRIRLMALDLQGFIPEIVDSDLDDYWVAFGVDPGLYSLEAVRASFPDGLKGRDAAWITKRILMVLEVAGRRNNLVPGNLLIHPEKHGIVLLGWQPIEDPDLYPLDQLKALLEANLAKTKDCAQQIEFIAKASEAFKENRVGQENLKIDSSRGLFGYGDVIREFTMKLRQIYGPDKFHELKVDPDYSLTYLHDESRLLRDAGKP